MVFGDCDVDTLHDGLRMYYGLEVGHVVRVTKDEPYAGEARCVDNTLVHVATEITLKHDLYTVEYIRSQLPLDLVQMPSEALERADLILVLLTDEDGRIYYYPYKNALYSDPEAY